MLHPSIREEAPVKETETLFLEVGKGDYESASTVNPAV